MGVIHHNKLRVNAVVPDDPDQMAVLREAGWASGLHKDSDLDDPVLIRDPTAMPRVLDPEPDDEEPEPEPAAKRTTRRK
jgi:hypothetical protein